MKSIIDVKNLSFRYKESQEYYDVKDITFHVKRGEWLSIVGHNGSGKSTTVRLIDGLLEAESGEIAIDGQRLTEGNVWSIRRQIGMVFQNPDNQFVGATVEDDVAFGLENQGLSRQEMKKRVEEALALVGMLDFKKREPARLSGGEKQRVAIARAIATNPKVLLCDEATSALDPNTTKQILELLKDINQKMGITVIIITHEMKVIESVCDRVAIIADSRIAEVGEVSKVFADPQSDVGKQLIVGETLPKTMPEGGKVIRIIFDGRSSFEPMIANMVLSSGVPVNILGASTKNIQGISSGQMVIQLPKDPVQANKILFYLTSNNVLFEGVSESELRSTDHKHDY